MTGEPDGPPTSVGLPICDLGTGMWGAQGILAALYERHRTGQGRKVECSLLETAVGFSSWTSAGGSADHEEPTRKGSRHRQNAPYQRCETKDGYMMIGAAGAGDLGALRRRPRPPGMVRGPALCDQRAAACRTATALEATMEAVLATEHDRSLGRGARSAAGVPCGPVYNYGRCSPTRRCKHRGLVQYADDPELGEVPHIRTPVKIGDAIRVRAVAPKLGQHNAEIRPSRRHPRRLRQAAGAGHRLGSPVTASCGRRRSTDQRCSLL